MLNVVYDLIAAVLAAGEQVFGLAFGARSGLTWLLSIGLVAVIASALRVPFFRAQIRAASRKEKNESAAARRVLVSSYFLGFVVQAVLFLGVLHVLRSFNRTTSGRGGPAMTVYSNASTPNYVLSADSVQHFLSARVMGAPLAACPTDPTSRLQAFAEYGSAPTSATITLAAVVFAVPAAILTSMNARTSPLAWAGRSRVASVMAFLAMWVVPVAILLSAAVLPVGALIYIFFCAAMTVAVHRVCGAASKRRTSSEASQVRRRRRGRHPLTGTEHDYVPLPNPKRAESDPLQAMYNMIWETGLANMVFGPGDIRSCFNALVAVAPVYRQSYPVHEIVCRFTDDPEGYWFLLQGPAGAAVVTCFGPDSDDNFRRYRIDQPLSNTPLPDSFVWGTMMGREAWVPAGFAEIFAHAEGLPIATLPAFANQSEAGETN